MTVLRPLLDEGATELEGKLLRSAGKDVPREVARQKALAALEAGAPPRTNLAAQGLGSLKVIVGSGALLAIAIAIYLPSRLEAPPARVEQDALPAQAPVPLPRLEAPPVVNVEIVEPAPVAAPEPVVDRAEPARRPKNAVAPRSSLAEELAIIDKAKRALSTGDPTTARRQLEGYVEKFPEGAFAIEAEGLGVEVAIASGDVEEARQRAARFLREHADSGLADRIAALARSLEPTP